ncbi:MAG: glycosyltransferase, partial [Duncaniella sp.]|nr:glycosyltransferase [Duncaniella sp.]
QKLLYVGGRQAYQNFKFLGECIRDKKFSLLICGSELSREETALLNKHIPGRYSNIVYPDNDELNKIYNSVYALAYPSSYEGFGIPVIEAQCCGCPVIALNASSIPEIIGDDSLLMNSLTKNEFLDKLDLLQDSGIRSRIISDGLENC